MFARCLCAVLLLAAVLGHSATAQPVNATNVTTIIGKGFVSVNNNLIGVINCALAEAVAATKAAGAGAAPSQQVQQKTSAQAAAAPAPAAASQAAAAPAAASQAAAAPASAAAAGSLKSTVKDVADYIQQSNNNVPLQGDALDAYCTKLLYSSNIDAISIKANALASDMNNDFKEMQAMFAQVPGSKKGAQTNKALPKSLPIFLDLDLDINGADATQQKNATSQKPANGTQQAASAQKPANGTQQAQKPATGAQQASSPVSQAKKQPSETPQTALFHKIGTAVCKFLVSASFKLTQRCPKAASDTDGSADATPLSTAPSKPISKAAAEAAQAPANTTAAQVPQLPKPPQVPAQFATPPGPAIPI